MESAVSLEQALEYCLQELARTGEVEASLLRYPQYAHELRLLLEVAQATQLHYTEVPEAPSGLAAGRERMLAAAAQQRARTVPEIPQQTSVDRIGLRRLLPMRFLASIFAVVVGMFFFGGGLIWAASDSLPGDPLYSVKLAVEDGRLAFASTPVTQVELALGFLEKRTGEIRSLTTDRRSIPNTTVDRLEQHVEHALVQAARANNKDVEDLLVQIQERAHAQAQILEQVQANAPETDQPQLERAVAICWRGAEEAENGLRDPEMFHRRDRHLYEDLTPTAAPEQERREHQNEENKEDDVRTPVSTPSATREVPRVTATPFAAPQGPPATVTPRATLGGPKPTATQQGPKATATPLVPRVTTAPQPTPEGPKATAAPQPTPGGPKATATPQRPMDTSAPHATPQGSGATPKPRTAPAVPGTTPGHPQATGSPEPPGGGHDDGGD